MSRFYVFAFMFFAKAVLAQSVLVKDIIDESKVAKFGSVEGPSTAEFNDHPET